MSAVVPQKAKSGRQEFRRAVFQASKQVRTRANPNVLDVNTPLAGPFANWQEEKTL